MKKFCQGCGTIHEQTDVLASCPYCGSFSLRDTNLPCGQGTKYSDGKPDMTLLDPYVLMEVARVMTSAANSGKYEAENWRKGVPIRKYMSAGLRHCFKFLGGEDLDPEWGHHHLAHALCCFMIVFWTVIHRRDLDDRYKHTGE